MRVTLFEAEVNEAGFHRTIVPVGTEVLLGDGWMVTISRESLACDCGKGPLCPSNRKVRVR